MGKNVQTANSAWLLFQILPHSNKISATLITAAKAQYNATY